MSVLLAQFILETQGVNAARTFLGYDPLPNDVAAKADAERKESRRRRDEALDRVNNLLAPYGVTL